MTLCKEIAYTFEAKEKSYYENSFAWENMAHWCSINQCESAPNSINKNKEWYKSGKTVYNN